MNLDKLRANLKDAKCSDQEILEIEKLLCSGHEQVALRKIKQARCSKLDAMHDCCRQIDCLDFLIRKTEKEIQANH